MSGLLPRSVIAGVVGGRDACCDPSLVRDCDGFVVRAELGTLGVVERVLFDRRGEPCELIVRRGLFRLRQVSVPVDAITSIDPVRRALVAGRWGRGGSSGAAVGA
jgi:hypothetical protein